MQNSGGGGAMKHKLESRLPWEIAITSDMQMTPLLWQKGKKNWRVSWWKWKRRVKCWLKTQHSKNEDHGIWSHYFMANKWGNSGNGGWLYFLGLQNTADGDCSYEIKRCLLLGRKAMTNLESILKSRDITLLTKFHLVKAVVFPVVMYGCNSWTIKKAEHQRTDDFELWCWRRLLRVPWSARRSNPSILKEISPECWKDWCWSWSSNTLATWCEEWFIGKDPDAGKDWGQEEKGTTEDEMVEWHLWLVEHEFEQTPGAVDGQGGLGCCSP